LSAGRNLPSSSWCVKEQLSIPESPEKLDKIQNSESASLQSLFLSRKSAWQSKEHILQNSKQMFRTLWMTPLK
jgi:hypothetical protein